MKALRSSRLHLEAAACLVIVLAAICLPATAFAGKTDGASVRLATPAAYTITPAAGDHGWIDPWTEQVVPAGGSARFTMGADFGYHIADVLIDGVSVGVRSSYEFTSVQADHTIDVIFAMDGEGPYTITPLAGAHGWIAPSTPQIVPAGASCRFTIGTAVGYHVADVLVDGASVGAHSSFQFTDVRTDHTISASFEADTVRTFTITPSAGAHGWIAPSTPQAVTAGGDCRFTIGTAAGYHVADVLVDGVSVGARTSYEFKNVQADHTISATFAKNSAGPFTITPAAGAHGSITPSSPQTVVAGGSVAFTMSADDGYHIADVLVDGASVGAVASFRFADVQADHTISASFAKDTAGTFTIVPTAGAHGSIDPPTAQSVAAGGSIVFAISADAGYHVAEVLVDGASVGARTAYEFVNVQADHTIAASFAQNTASTFTITPSAGAHGRITPSGPQSVDSGGSALFTITADAGYHVSEVLVDGADVGARHSYEFVDVQADHTISASFAVDAGPVITVTRPAGGETWRSGSAQAIRWTLSDAVSAGRFTVWASSLSGELTRLTPAGSPVVAAAGSTAYHWSYRVTLPAARTYRIIVRYETVDGVVQSEAASAGRVQVVAPLRLSVTAPKGAVAWRRDTRQKIAWKVSEALGAGAFRLWAENARGVRYQVTSAAKPVVAVGSKKAYSYTWKVNVPAGTGYHIVVEHWSGAAKTATGKSVGSLTIRR